MKTSTIITMGLLAFLFGCGPGGNYRKKKGEWYYKDDNMHLATGTELTPLGDRFAKSKESAYYQGATIVGVDAATFQALGDHYAKDKSRVYWCDTYRDSKEYWSIKHIKTPAIIGADAASFRQIDDRYARDIKGVFYEGTEFPVKDVESFQLIDAVFAKDKITGYFARVPIPESDGATFMPLTGNYSKDAQHVFYSGISTGTPNPNMDIIRVILALAHPETFAPLEHGYGMDSTRLYYHERLLENSAGVFRVLNDNYAASSNHVYYQGNVLKGADAATFEAFPFAEDQPTGKDKNGFFSYDKRLKK